MGTLYRIELNDEAKTTVRLGAPWPDEGLHEGVPLSQQYLVGAIFYSPLEEEEERENEKGEIETVGEDTPAYFEIWAQPKGIPEPPDDHPTFCMRLWLDWGMKSTIEVYRWSEAEKAIAIRMGFDPDELVEPTPAPVPANGVRPPVLNAAQPQPG